ncbi:NAD(P)/FAD-dependent oxidoreductase [Actinoplanes sp. NPDC000266]
MNRSGVAYVIGGSIAGLLATRVLAEHFDRVVLLDRDALPSGPRPRHAVPQSRQANMVLSRGVAALEELLPGLTKELVTAGAAVGDVMQDAQWIVDGAVLPRQPSGLLALVGSHPLVEHTIRARVARMPGVEIVPGSLVDGLLTTADNRRVTGVRLLAPGGVKELTDAELVVDASGRATLAPRWLTELGYPPPPTVTLRVNLTYVTRSYRRSGHDIGGRLGTVVLNHPGMPYGGCVLAQGKDRCSLVIAAAGAAPPVDENDFLAVCRRFAGNTLYDLARYGVALGRPQLMRFPVERWRRFDQAERYPAGLLPIGDAICSLNPTYGQGVTVAALQALRLRDLLGRPDGTPFSARFLAESAAIIADAWQIAGSLDRQFLGGYEPLSDPIARLRAAASKDPSVAAAFLRVMQGMQPPQELTEPALMARVAAALES